MSLGYIRSHYRVPAKRGALVRPRIGPHRGQLARILSAKGAYVRVRDAGKSSPCFRGSYHPNDLQYVELIEAHRAYIKRVKAEGFATLASALPCCALELEFPLPPAGQTWDSLIECPDCRTVLFKVATAEGVQLFPAPGKADG